MEEEGRQCHTVSRVRIWLRPTIDGVQSRFQVIFGVSISALSPGPKRRTSLAAHARSVLLREQR